MPCNFLFRPECRSFVSDQTQISSINDRAKVPRKLNPKIFALCICFGMGTWLPVNAIYSQMSILTQSTPEQWSLPSYFSILVQLANLVPLLYYLNKEWLIPHESLLISSTLLLGTISTIGLAFTYHITFYIFNQPRSVLFMIFSFFTAAVGCVSSLLYLPFMNHLSEGYLIAFFMGEGLCNLIPGVLAFAQHYKTSCSSPHFNSTIFLLIVSLFTLLSFVCFRHLAGIITIEEKPDKSKLLIKSQHPGGGTATLKILLLLQTIVSFFECGILDSIQSYSCLPYGQHAYQWSISLIQIIQPSVMYLGLYMKLTSLKALAAICIPMCICWTYELSTAFMSPTPPFYGHEYGALHIVSTDHEVSYYIIP